MRKKKIFIVLVIISLLAVGLTGYYWYQKPRQSLENIKPQYTMSAAQLYGEFSTSEASANKKYIEKIVQVEGEIDQIQTSDSTVSILLKGGEMGGINCTLLFQNALPKPLPVKGSQIRVKGKCIGFLMDVNILDAVIVK